MKYIYGALLLHRLGKEISEENLKKIISATETNVDEAAVKTLVTSLKGVDIDKAIAEAKPLETAGTAAKPKEEKKEEEKKEEKVEMVAEGLSALFG